MARHASFDVRRFSPFVFPCALGVCALVAGTPGVSRAAPPAVEAPYVQPPAVLEESRPPYPVEAQGAKGDVAVTATITPAGDVSGVELATGVAPPLDRAALKAAMSWRFRPALRDGVPIARRVQLLFHFEPPAAPPPEVQAPAGPALATAARLSCDTAERAAARRRSAARAGASTGSGPRTCGAEWTGDASTSP